MRSGSHVQLAALRNSDLELQILCLKRQVVMVQFLSIKLFCWISSIFVGFFKSSRFFCVSLYKCLRRCYVIHTVLVQIERVVKYVVSGDVMYFEYVSEM